MVFSLQPPWWEAQVAEFRTLCLSLNAPVIAIDELPVGPARAGIALGVESSGSLRLQIAIRSLRTGQVIAFAPGDDPADEEAAARALEAGFSFAEGMGFLFDDDDVTIRDAGDLNASWREFIGEAAMPETTSGAADADVPAEPAVIDLIHEVAVKTPPTTPDLVAVAVEIERPAFPADGSECVAILSKHRLVLGGVRSEAARRADDSPVDEGPSNTSAHTQDTRIRLLGRF